MEAVPTNGDRIIALARTARSRILPGPEENMGVSIDIRMNGIADLVLAGEDGVAFEVLSDNLLDYDIRLTEDDFAETAAIAVAIGVEHARYFTPLRDLVVSPDRIVVTRTVE